MQNAMPEYLIKIFVFGFGACIGSFLNVCIYRLPAEKSLVFPPSRCPQCERRIRWWDNIPLLSYILLRGRCRFCGLGIPFRYFLVELLTAVGALAVYQKSGLTPEGIFHFVFLAALIVVIYIDLDHQIIPDGITLPGIVLFFLAAVLTQRLAWSDSLAGIVVGGGFLFAVAVVYKLVKKVDGMGGGDIKLLAMIGAWCGWPGVGFTLLVSSLTGSLISLVLMVVYRQGMQFRVPFGPFLSLGALLYIFFGPELINWYFMTI